MPVDVMELTAAREGLWEAYVARHARATFFHTLAWRDAVQSAFAHEPHYLLAFGNGSLTGVFPMMCVRSHLAGTLLVSVPYAVYGGGLFDDQESRDALLGRAELLAERLGARWLDIRSAEALHPGLPVVDRYVTFRRPLPADPADVPGTLPRKARAAARQARARYGLRVEFGDEHLETVWRLYSQSMRRLASPNYPLAFFRALIERTAEGRGHLVQLVLHRDRPIAGLVSFLHRGTFMPYFAGCDERFEKYHPNNFLYLTAMERGVELGCREFDFGRSRLDNTGSCGFKRNQGFAPAPLGYQYYVPKGGTAPDLYPTSPKARLARRIWPRLPLALTRPLGAWLAKSIPG